MINDNFLYTRIVNFYSALRYFTSYIRSVVASIAIMPVQSSVIIHFVGQHGNNDARCRQSQDRDRLLAAARLAGRSGRAAVKQ